MYIPKQEVLERALAKEIERFCFADSLLNRIVYDCVDPSIYTKVLIIYISFFIINIFEDIDPGVMDMTILPFFIPNSKKDTTLVFESRFESGNLRRAIQM